MQARSDLAIRVPSELLATSGLSLANSTLQPQQVYDGGYGNSSSSLRLRIGNGGAGQSGLIGAWADAFIQYSVNTLNIPPFLVGWYLGDTTQSLSFLAAGEIDIAVTYNEAAEEQAMQSGNAVQDVYGFRDHFYLVGPVSDPANLKNVTKNAPSMFNQIVKQGNSDVATPPMDRDPTRFLSRFDKSATNIKESALFCQIGQVPWAYTYSTWYHQYPRFPLQALQAASLLSEYTLTDRGTWLSSPSSVTDALAIYLQGSDDANDPLLNPAHVLLGAKANPGDKEIWEAFMTWVVDANGGQKVIREFLKGGQQLYSEAPSDSQ